MKLLITIALSLICTAQGFATEPVPPPPSLPQNYLPVPLVPQATHYSCGAAALMAVMEYWNVFDAPETTLFKRLHTTIKDGTEGVSIARVAQNDYGLGALIRTGLGLRDLADALKDGTTVILDLQAWADTPVTDWKSRWEDGHYVVLVAMDINYAYLMDPSSHGAYAYIALTELMDRWHDYEDRSGHIQLFYNLGILIKGKAPRTRYPAPLVRML